jgi:hypothetical protein
MIGALVPPAARRSAPSAPLIAPMVPLLGLPAGTGSSCRPGARPVGSARCHGRGPASWLFVATFPVDRSLDLIAELFRLDRFQASHGIDWNAAARRR